MAAEPQSPSTSSTTSATTGPVPLPSYDESFDEYQEEQQQQGMETKMTNDITNQEGIMELDDKTTRGLVDDKRNEEQQEGSVAIPITERIEHMIVGGRFGNSPKLDTSDPASVPTRPVTTAEDDGENTTKDSSETVNGVKSTESQNRERDDVHVSEGDQTARIRSESPLRKGVESLKLEDKDQPYPSATPSDSIQSVYGYRPRDLVAIDLQQQQQLLQQDNRRHPSSTKLPPSDEFSRGATNGQNPVDLDVTIDSLDTTLDGSRLLKALPDDTAAAATAPAAEANEINSSPVDLDDTVFTQDTLMSPQLKAPSGAAAAATAENHSMVDLDDTTVTQDTLVAPQPKQHLKPPPSDFLLPTTNGSSSLVDLDDTIMTHDTLLSKVERLQSTNSQPSVQGGATKSQNKCERDDDEAQEPKPAWVNEGLQRWEQARKEWLGMNRRQPTTSLPRDMNEEAPPPPKPGATSLDVDEIIDIIFLSSLKSNNNAPPARFPVNVPLPQMVDILQDLWEAEGLDA
ncbi:hypothetical protein ACA910_008610 [Epithemia clementina (nom. ined.)]